MSRAYKPDETRRQILDAAYTVIHRHGFQAAGLNDILAMTGVTKGAMYHHFPGKTALGYAVVDELVKAYLEDWWLAPLDRSEESGDDDDDVVAEGGVAVCVGIEKHTLAWPRRRLVRG